MQNRARGTKQGNIELRKSILERKEINQSAVRAGKRKAVKRAVHIRKKERVSKVAFAQEEQPTVLTPCAGMMH